MHLATGSNGYLVTPLTGMMGARRKCLHRNREVTMNPQYAIDEAEIRQRIARLIEAIRSADLEGVKFIYAPDIVSFDIVPPLQHRGAEAQWKNWQDVFTTYQHPLDYEVRDLAITVGRNVAFGHSLNRI